MMIQSSKHSIVRVSDYDGVDTYMWTGWYRKVPVSSKGWVLYGKLGWWGE